MDTFAQFKSRNDAINIFNKLKQARLAVTIINTPAKQKKGCGLSIAFNSAYKKDVERIIKENNVKSFVGIYNR